jgi:hypothetical protein
MFTKPMLVGCAKAYYRSNFYSRPRIGPELPMHDSELGILRLPIANLRLIFLNEESVKRVASS